MPATPNIRTIARRASITIIIVSIATWKQRIVHVGGVGAAGNDQRELHGYIDIEHRVVDF